MSGILSAVSIDCRPASLSYLPRLRSSSVEVREISSSAHFLFYDNPVETFQAVGEFVHAN